MKWNTILSWAIPILIMTILVMVTDRPNDHVDALSTLDPYFNIELDSNKYQANVHLGSDGIVWVSGNVTVHSSWDQVQNYTVEIIVNCDGWPTSMPEKMIFTKEVTRISYVASIQVPIETSSMTRGQLSIAGRWASNPGIDGGNIETKTALVYVNQYYDLAVKSEETHANVTAGGSLGFRCRLINQGNGDDRVKVEIVNDDELTAMNWTVQLSQDKFQLPEKQETVLVVSVTVGNLTSPGNHSIKLRFFSAEAESLGETSYEVELDLTIDVQNEEVNKLPDIGVAPLIAIIILLSALISLIRRRIR